MLLYRPGPTRRLGSDVSSYKKTNFECSFVDTVFGKNTTLTD